MKFLIATTLLFVCNLFVVFVLNPVSLSVLIVGVVFAGVFMGYSFFVRKERDLFKEENQLFIDTFQKIRNPIALVKTPLEVACHQCESDRLRNELLIVIRSLACLDQHMSDLLSLKYLFLRSGDTGIAEHELGTFIRHRIHLLKPLAERRGIELQCTAGFDFLSVWINTKVVAPVIDRFVKYTILGATSGERIVFSITGNNDYWSIKTQHAEEADTLVLYQKYLSLLLQTKLIGTFQRGALIKKLLNLCNGKLVITSTDVELRFPTLSPTACETADTLYGNISLNDLNTLFAGSEVKKRESGKPFVIVADGDESFGCYLKKCLSDFYNVKCYQNGQEAYDAILAEYPDLIICDASLDGMGGDELSSRLKTSKHSSFIPIILLATGIDMDKREKRAYSLADIFMYKPLHPEDLKVEISVLINNSLFLRKSFLQMIFGERFIEPEHFHIGNDYDRKFINQVKEYVLNALEDENLNISSIASRIGMSRTAFYTRWKGLTGEAPKYFIYKVRMEKARELLESGKYTVNEIPEMVGLRNLKNFRIRYKEYFGRSPKESIKR